jgi:hypothetical protein
MNKLEASLSQNDLNSLFSTKVEKVDNKHFYIRTKTHKIHIKNPKVTWEKPYTEPKQTKIELVDTTETFIGATSPSRTELFFHGVASIENFPDLALKNKAIQLLTDFERLRIPTEAELLIKELEPEMLEDGTTWFKLSKLYNALDGRGTIPDDMSDRKFWTNAHKRLEQFEHIYIKTINPYTKYPNVAVIHYKVTDLKNILNCLNTEGIIHAEQLIEKLQ